MLMRITPRLGYTIALSALLLASCRGLPPIQSSDRPTYDNSRPAEAAQVSLGERRRPQMNPGGEAEGGMAVAPASPVIQSPARGGEAPLPTAWADETPAQPAPSISGSAGIQKRRPALNEQAPGELPMAASATAQVEPVHAGDAYPNLASVPARPRPYLTPAEARLEMQRLEAERQQSATEQNTTAPSALPEVKMAAPGMPVVPPPAELPSGFAPAPDAGLPPVAAARELPPIELKAPAPQSAAVTPQTVSVGDGQIPVTFSDEAPQGAIPAGPAISAAEAGAVPPQNLNVSEASVAAVEPIQLVAPDEEARPGSFRPVPGQARRLLPESRYATIRRQHR